MAVSIMQALILGEWECSDCGYYASGSSKKAPKRCPDCGAPSAAFDFWPDEDEDWDDEDDYDDDNGDDG